MSRWKPLDLSQVSVVDAANGEQCIACPEAAAWLVEFNEKTRWWHESRFGLCLDCFSGTAAGWVYFIRAGEFVKIGYSTEPAKRLSNLATASPFPLELWGTTPGSQADERALHRKFAKDRAHGEWFHISDRIHSYVLSIGGAA